MAADHPSHGIPPSSSSVHDRYSASAGAYDLFTAAYRPDQVAALEALQAHLKPSAGPILDVGCGSGLNSAWVLTELPEAEVFAIEPSPSMRALALQRIAAQPEWFPRVTVRPEGFFSAPLPLSIGGAILLGVLGHFDAGERAAVFAELAARLTVGSAALIDLQQPEAPTRVEPFVFTAATIGQIRYEAIAEAWPIGGERMQWRMTYLVLEGERVLTDDAMDHIYHHPSIATVTEEASAVGLDISCLGETTFWILSRPS